MDKFELGILKKLFSSNSDNSKKLDKMKVILRNINTSLQPKVLRRCYSIFRHGMNEDDSYLQYCALEMLTPNSNPPLKTDDLIFLSYLVLTLGNKSGRDSFPTQYQDVLADLYARLILESRAKLPHNITEVARYLVGAIPLPKIRDSLLPNLKKAMLRNPETTIFNVSTLFMHLLSSGTVGDIQSLAEILLPHLISSNEEIASQTLHIFGKYTACPINSFTHAPNNAGTIAEALITFYKSPSCKQITPKVKANILDALKGVTQASAKLPKLETASNQNIVHKLMELIEPETHELLVSHAFDALITWLKMSDGSVLDDPLCSKLKSFVENGMASKSQPVRTKYLELLEIVLGKSKNVEQFHALIPNVCKLSETLSNQPANTYNSILCNNLILCLTQSDDSTCKKYEAQIKSALKMGQICLQREKMLSGPAPHPENNQLMGYLSHVRLALKQYPLYVNLNDLVLYTKALVTITCTAKSHQIRQFGLDTIKSYVASLQDGEQPVCLPISLLVNLREMLKAFHNSTKRWEETKSSETTVVVNYVWHCMCAICFPSPDYCKRIAAKDREGILTQALLTSCHPSISNANRPFIKIVLRRYYTSPNEFVTKHVSTIVREIFAETLDPNKKPYSAEWCQQILSVLIKLSPKITVSKVIPFLLETMGDREKYKISPASIAIYNTPPCSLQNRKIYTDIIEGLQSTKLPTKPPGKLGAIKDAVERDEMKRNWEIYNYLLTLQNVFTSDGSNKFDPQLEKYLDHKQKAALVDEYLREQKIRHTIDKDLGDFKFKAYLMSSIFSTRCHSQITHLVDDLMTCFLWHLRTNPLTSPIIVDLVYQLAKLVSPNHHLSLVYRVVALIIGKGDGDSEAVNVGLDRTSTDDCLGPLSRITNELSILSSKRLELAPGTESAILDLAYFIFDDNRFINEQLIKEGPGGMEVIEIFLNVIGKHLEPISSMAELDSEILGEDIHSKATTKLLIYAYKPKIFPRLRILQILNKVMDLSYDNLDNLSHQILRKMIAFNESHPVTDGTKYIIDELSVILKHCLSPQPKVREIYLSLLASYKDCVSSHFKNHQQHLSQGVGEPKDEGVWQDLMCAVWIEKFDSHKPCHLLADRVWQDCKLIQPPWFMGALVDYSIRTSEQHLHHCCGEAIVDFLNTCPDSIDSCIGRLFMLYEDRHKPLPALHDAFGRSLGIKVSDEYPARRCIAIVITYLVNGLKPQLKTEARLFELFSFIIGQGLKDRDADTRELMLKAALAIIQNGDENPSLGNKFVDATDKKLLEAPLSAEYDDMRQGLVILLGHLAKNIGAGDPRIESIFKKLISALTTPSQSVQESVATCLVILTPNLSPAAVEAQHEQFWATIIDEKAKFAVRKGAAYGLAGLLKGFGLGGLKKYNTIDKLNAALADKKNSRKREGALFVLESLTRIYGKQMEPYALAFMPTLLTCFGDGLGFVREAAQDAFKAITACLTSHGINLMIPILTEALSDEAWRTQIASIEMLGSMSHCAPDQLSSCLPTIVPKLVDTLSNSHDKVRDSGAQALRSIGSVMQNPEIRERVDILIDTMRDPDTKSASCLKTLLGTRLFVHAIDTASLALLMPVIQRTMQDRSSEIRKMALHVLADVFNLTSESDVRPYLVSLLPRMKVCLVDPLPEVRNQASQALGNLVGVVDKGLIDELVSWLMKTLVSETSAVDRSGAAQGLSMMVHKLGIGRLDSILVDVIQTLQTPNLPSPVKDGYLLMLLYLPSVFGVDFIPYLDKIVPSLLLGLADESEYVRLTGIKAGKRIITMYSVSTMSTFLPEIERGLLVTNWRIRYSSVQLIGELLFHILGVTGKMTTVSEEDETFASEAATEVLSQTLGVERQNKILSALYICSCDTRDEIAAASLHIWKIVVHNTARMLKQILTQLIPFILFHISSDSKDLITIAGRTIGQVVRKLEGVLPEFLSILRQRFDASLSAISPDSEGPDNAFEIRRGVCVAIKEILNNTSRDMITMYGDAIDHILSLALADDEESVREAAVQALDKYHSVCGQKMFETMIPQLLNKVEKGDNISGLVDGLKGLVILKSRAILPYIIPKLDTDFTKCGHLYELLAFSSEGALDKYADQVLPKMIDALETLIKGGELDVELYLSSEVDEDNESKVEKAGVAGKNDENDDNSDDLSEDDEDGSEDSGDATDSIREILGLFENEESVKHLFDGTIFPAIKSLDTAFGYETPDESDDSPVPVTNARCLAGLVVMHMYLTNEEADPDIDTYRLACVKALAPTLKARDLRVVRLTSVIFDIIFEVLSLPLQDTSDRTRNNKPNAPNNDDSEDDTDGPDSSSESDQDDTEAIREILVALKNFFRSAGSPHASAATTAARDGSGECYELAGLQIYPAALVPLRSLLVEKGMLHPDFGVKEQAVQAVLELVKVSPAPTLKPVILKFMGPVLRLLTQRYNPSFRAALLQICAALLYKNNVSLKAFVPQLQATFFKALKDADQNVRIQGARGLAHLMPIHPKPTNVYNELILIDPAMAQMNGYCETLDANETNFSQETPEYKKISMKKTTLYALRLAIPQTTNMAESLAKTVMDKLLAYTEAIVDPSTCPADLDLECMDDENKRITMGCLGAVCQHLTQSDFLWLLSDRVLSNANTNDDDDVGYDVCLYVIAKKCPSRLENISQTNPRVWEKFVDVLHTHLLPDGKVNMAISTIKTLLYLVSFYISTGADIPTQLLAHYTKAMNHKSHDVKMLALNTVYYAYEMNPCLGSTLAATLEKNENTPTAPIKSFTQAALQTLQKGCNDGNSIVRNQAENVMIRLLAVDAHSCDLAVLSAFIDSDRSKTILEDLKILVEKTLQKKIQNKKGTQVKMTIKPLQGLMLEQDQIDETIII